MNKRTTRPAERVHLIECHLAGQSYHQIAAQSGLNYYTVRKWIRRYKARGWSGVQPAGVANQRAGALSRFDPLVK